MVRIVFVSLDIFENPQSLGGVEDAGNFMEIFTHPPFVFTQPCLSLYSQLPKFEDEYDFLDFFTHPPFNLHSACIFIVLSAN